MKERKELFFGDWEEEEEVGETRSVPGVTLWKMDKHMCLGDG